MVIAPDLIDQLWDFIVGIRHIRIGPDDISATSRQRPVLAGGAGAAVLVKGEDPNTVELVQQFGRPISGPVIDCDDLIRVVGGV